MRPVSTTGLYWSIYGEAACASHAPQVDDLRWSIEGWVPIQIVSGDVLGALYSTSAKNAQLMAWP
jgi:hypothetical protein